MTEKNDTSSAATEQAPRPGRRLRRAVRAADRASRARGGRVQRDRSAHRDGGRDRGEEPRRHHPPADPRRDYEEGALARCAVLDLGVPTLGICYGFQVMAQAWVARWPTRACAVRRDRFDRRVRGCAAAGPACRAERVDEPRRPGRARAAEGFEVLARTGRRRGRVRERCPPPLRRAVAPEVKHSDFGQRVLENFLHDAAVSPPTGTAATSSPSRSPASAAGRLSARHLRALGRRRLRCCRRARA